MEQTKFSLQAGKFEGRVERSKEFSGQQWWVAKPFKVNGGSVDLAAEEAALVEAVRLGDREAFSRLWMRAEAPLYHYIIAISRNREEASDILQETAHQAMRALLSGRYQHDGRFNGWLYKIAKNVFLGACRRRKHALVQLDVLVERDVGPPALTSESPETLAITRSMFEFLDLQLEERLAGPTLSAQVREEGRIKKMAFFWYYHDGLSLNEVVGLVRSQYCARNWSPPTAASVNNWLAGGRLVDYLVDHLVKHHPEALEKLWHSLRSILEPRELAAWMELNAVRRQGGSVDRLDPAMRVLAGSADRKLIRSLQIQVKEDLHRARMAAGT